MIDWVVDERLLLQVSKCAFDPFFEHNSSSTVSAVGFVFELWNLSEQFDICLDTRAHSKRTQEAYLAKWPDIDKEEIRWNSGEFEFPAGLHSDSYLECMKPWTERSKDLHAIANQEEGYGEVYQGLVAISSKVLATHAQQGLFGDWNNIDFNVAEVGDEIEVIKERDQTNRGFIASVT